MIKSDIEKRAWEVLNRIEFEKEKSLDQVVREAVEEAGLDYQNKEEQIRELKAMVDEIQREKREKEVELRQIKQISELDELKDISEIDIDNYEVADKSDRDKFAQKIIYLGQLVKDNEYLSEDTLKTFDLYRERMVERSIDEKDLGDKIDSLT